MDYDASGKLLLEHHGNGIGTQNRYHPTRGFLESSRTLRWTTNAHLQEYEMQLDDLGNVLWRREQRYVGTPDGQPVTRTETFGYDRLNRLTYSAVTGQSMQNFTFAANGNIASKSGIGSYGYGERGHGPHAVTSVTVGTEVQRSYSYDAKGRMTTEHVGTNLALTPLREIAYTSFDQPRFIQHWGAAALSSDVGALDDGVTPWDQVCTLRFYFGPGLQRLIQVKHKGALVTKVLSLGGYEIREVTSGSLTGTMIEREERSSFGNGTRVKRWTAASPTVPVIAYEFAAKDHLGSDTATFDSTGQLQPQRGHLKEGEVQKSERQSYDAWGARRDGETWAPAEQGGSASSNPTAEKLGSNLPRGYTGHEMLDDVGLIHMNGRLYDCALGRMCAVDRDVQAPDMVQNYNRYSYVLNNPMNATDPSGHNWLRKVATIVVAVIIAVIIAIVAVWAVGLMLQAAGSVVGVAASTSSFIFSSSATFGTIAGLNGGIVVAAAVGATWSAVNMTIAGGSFSQVLKSAVTGAANGAIGAIVGGYMHGLGVGMESMLAGGTSWSGTAVHLAAHGLAGGAMSEANGGSFRDGFIGGLVSAGVSGITTKYFGDTALFNPENKAVWAVAGRTAIAGITGGIASLATGGKFADGAYSAAFFHLFNNEVNGRFSDKSVNGMDADQAQEYYERLADSRAQIYKDNKPYLDKNLFGTAANAPTIHPMIGGIVNESLNLASKADALWHRIYFDDGDGGNLGECVALVKNLAKASKASSWRSGGLVVDNKSLRPGTAIASMVPKSGIFRTYYRFESGYHAAIFIKHTSNGGIIVFDQFTPFWNGRHPQVRTLQATGDHDNNSNYFHIIK